MTKLWLTLSTLLPLLVLPMGIWFWCLLMFFLLRNRTPRIAKSFIVFGTTILLVFSLPSVANRLIESLEQQYPTPALNDIPNADVIVLLDGGVNARDRHRQFTELGPGSDRLLLTHRLFQANKAPAIWLAGDVVDLIDPTSEDNARSMLTAWGIPSTAISGEMNSRNTYENALEFSRVAGERNWNSVILITSSTHMPRSMQQFRHHGIEPFPVGADHWVSPYPMTGLSGFFPQAQALNKSTRVLREYLGILVYAVVHTQL